MWCNNKILLLSTLFLIVYSMANIKSSSAQNSPQDFLAAHNRVRAELGIGSMKWNGSVANYAQNYANSRIEKCEFEHSMGQYGENIAMGYGDLEGKDAVTMWASEKPYYDPNSNSCVNGEECLHYTQIIWRDSVHLGCARSHCKNGWVFVTCNYYPPGNIEGLRPY